MTFGETKTCGFASTLPKVSSLPLGPYACKSRSFQWAGSMFAIKYSLHGLATFGFEKLTVLILP